MISKDQINKMKEVARIRQHEESDEVVLFNYINKNYTDAVIDKLANKCGCGCEYL